MVERGAIRGPDCIQGDIVISNGFEDTSLLNNFYADESIEHYDTENYEPS